MKALVLFSGGLDSTTALALAISKYGKENVVALSVSYGQKHIKEIEASNKIAAYYDVEHIYLDLAKIFQYSNCSLLSQNKDIAIPEGEYAKQLQEQNGALSTYVPFRNGLFLSSAASIALSKDCDIIYYGAHADDAAGEAYPDCSVEYVVFLPKCSNPSFSLFAILVLLIFNRVFYPISTKCFNSVYTCTTFSTSFIMTFITRPS